jgi:hypothetical protein
MNKIQDGWYEMPLAPGRTEVQKNSNWRTPNIPGVTQPVQQPILPGSGNGPTPLSLPGRENVHPPNRQK